MQKRLSLKLTIPSRSPQVSQCGSLSDQVDSPSNIDNSRDTEDALYEDTLDLNATEVEKMIITYLRGLGVNMFTDPKSKKYNYYSRKSKRLLGDGIDLGSSQLLQRRTPYSSPVRSPQISTSNLTIKPKSQFSAFSLQQQTSIHSIENEEIMAFNMIP